MAHIRFHRADGQGLRTLLREAFAKRVGFDGIADPRAGAVRLDEAQVGGVYPEISIDLLQKPPL